MAATIDQKLRERLAERPGEQYDVIVRTAEDATALADYCVRHGMVVHRTFRLLPALALTATGDALLALADVPQVTCIEPDLEVHVT